MNNPVSNTRYDKPQQKRRGPGPEKKVEAMDHQRMINVLAQGLVKDQTLHSAYGYTKSTNSEYLHSSLQRITTKDTVLVFVMKGSNRKVPTLPLKALVALNQLVPSIAEEPANKEESAMDEEPASDSESASNKECASENLALLQQDIIETRNETSKIFNLPSLKCVVDSLDPNSSEQMSRYGSKQISIQNKRMPNENTRY